MKIYMSYWSKSNSNSVWLDLWKLSTALVLKHYQNIELITDSNGYENLKSLPFSNFHICLDSLTDYLSIWSLGKIYAYLKACSLNESFLHLDHDIFLWEPLPDTLTNSNIFCQSKDHYSMGNGLYDTDLLLAKTGCNIPNYWLNNKNLVTYNMGIFGGTNLQMIENYCNVALDLVNNKDFQELWKFSSNDSWTYNSKAILVEQGTFAVFCKHHNLIPNLLFDNMYNHQADTYKKYTHLMNFKYDPEVIQSITNRVATKPYNLSPVDVPIEEW